MSSGPSFASSKRVIDCSLEKLTGVSSHVVQGVGEEADEKYQGGSFMYDSEDIRGQLQWLTSQTAGEASESRPGGL